MTTSWRTRNSRRTVITGSIARSAKRQYLSYSEADFEVFRPAGATRYTDGGDIWRGGGDQSYVHWKSGNISEIVHDKDAGTADQ